MAIYRGVLQATPGSGCRSCSYLAIMMEKDQHLQIQDTGPKYTRTYFTLIFLPWFPKSVEVEHQNHKWFQGPNWYTPTDFTLLGPHLVPAGYLNLVTLWVVIECLGAIPQRKDRIRFWKSKLQEEWSKTSGIGLGCRRWALTRLSYWGSPPRLSYWGSYIRS